MIINSTKTKKTAWDLVVSHLIGLFVRLTQWKNISGDHGSKVISSLVNSWVYQLKDANNVTMYIAVFNHCFVYYVLLSPL